MGYYIRVLGVNAIPPTVDDLRNALSSAKSSAILNIETGTEANWQQLVLTHTKGTQIATIEFNPVTAGELGKDELDEFIAELDHYKPATAAQWLRQYLPRVAAIYAFQLLSGTEAEGGWDAVHTLQSAIWSTVGGVLQADGEGFSNEDGYTILWQFSDGVSGRWNMAVLDKGSWVAFEMDLANAKQRQLFFDGKVPRGVRRL